ncbi:hypothetical protein SKAU_G00334540 [Synaphobranchus kaupii]|uniref:Uncharacterized protein n=1 Tax=Synaphobranchus kaupii TaxID=118154 RepID=A0A9Q1ELT4_SYNKA|nr:hypothetical protein SKAU_G00334540 [Synaphobranchus kaupii]
MPERDLPWEPESGAGEPKAPVQRRPLQEHFDVHSGWFPLLSELQVNWRGARSALRLTSSPPEGQGKDDTPRIRSPNKYGAETARGLRGAHPGLQLKLMWGLTSAWRARSRPPPPPQPAVSARGFARRGLARSSVFPNAPFRPISFIS